MLIKAFDPIHKHSNRQHEAMGISIATESPVASLDSRPFWLTSSLAVQLQITVKLK